MAHEKRQWPELLGKLKQAKPLALARKLPPDVKAAITQISSFLIITAIAALGMKTSLLALARIGMAPVLLLITETAFIGLLVVGLIYALRPLGM